MADETKITMNTEDRATALLEQLEADGLDFAEQTRTLIGALGIQFHRINEAVRDDMVDAVTTLLRGAHDTNWPTPGTRAVRGALERARETLTPDGVSVTAYCPATALPFVVVLNGDGELVRASTGKPRNAAEQAEAARQATRSLRARDGLRLVDDDPIH